MGTRSVIAIPEGDSWRGRYCHWDGYPSHQGQALSAIVARDGLAVAAKTLVEDNYGWSSVDADQPDITGVAPRERQIGEGWSPETIAQQFTPDGIYGDGRFVNMPGYGVAYTTTGGQSKPDDWIRPGDPSYWEWIYVLSAGGLLVIKRYRGDGQVVGLFRWSESIDWGQVTDMAYASI